MEKSTKQEVMVLDMQSKNCLRLIWNRLNQRKKYVFKLMENKEELDQVLLLGANKARKTASDVLKRVRAKLGYL